MIHFCQNPIQVEVLHDGNEFSLNGVQPASEEIWLTRCQPRLDIEPSPTLLKRIIFNSNNDNICAYSDDGTVLQMGIRR